MMKGKFSPLRRRLLAAMPAAILPAAAGPAKAEPPDVAEALLVLRDAMTAAGYRHWELTLKTPVGSFVALDSDGQSALR